MTRHIMRIAGLTFGSLLLLAVPSRASVIYSFFADYSATQGPGSTVSWEFDVPQILTTPTEVTTFLSASLGPAFAACGSITGVQIPQPPNNDNAPPGTYAASLSTLWSTPCGAGDAFVGAGAQFTDTLTSSGVYLAYGHATNAVIGSLTISPEPASFVLCGLAGTLLFLLARSRAAKRG